MKVNWLVLLIFSVVFAFFCNIELYAENAGNMKKEGSRMVKESYYSTTTKGLLKNK